MMGSLDRVVAHYGVGETPTDLHHERAVRSGSDASNVHFSRRQLNDDEHIVRYEPADTRGSSDHVGL